MESSFVAKLANSVFYISRGDKHLLLNTELPNWIVLNENSAFIVGLIDGKKSIAEIIEHLKCTLNITLNIEKVVKLFSELEKHGIINDEKLLEKKDFLSSQTCSHPKLHLVHIKLTDECNLSCKYCYAQSGILNRKFLELDQLKKIVKDLNEIANNIDYTLSGGEPLLYPHAIELMEYINFMGNKIFLLTNGMLITKENAPLLAKLCFLIKISIDGSCEEINALTRGKNSFKAALNGYELLRAEGANVQIAMTVTKANIDDIDNMAKKFGNSLTLQPFFKAGRGTENDHLQISGEEYYEAMAKVEGFQPMGSIGELLENIKGKGMTKCAMADAEISISENGDVFPCQMLTDKELKGGNILETDILSILNSEIFKKISTFSSLTNAGCNVCPIKLLCGGACRARSYLETGDLFINSDFCEYEKLAYINGIFDYYEFDGDSK